MEPLTLQASLKVGFIRNEDELGQTLTLSHATQVLLAGIEQNMKSMNIEYIRMEKHSHHLH